MKKASLLLVSVFLLATSSPVTALGIMIDSSGKTTLYNDGVLGDSTENPTLQKKTAEMIEQHKAELRKQKQLEIEKYKSEQQAIKQQSIEEKRLLEKQEKERKLLQQQAEQERKAQIAKSAAQKKQQPVKQILPSEDKYLTVGEENGETKVEIRSKAEEEFEEVEEVETDQVELEIPTTLERETEELRFNEQIQEINREAQELRKENPEDRQFIQQVRHDRVKEVIEERKLRLTELVHLRKAPPSSGSALTLTSREVTVEVEDELEVAVDPETNEIGVVTATGEIVSINHLPDQAKDRLGELGLLEKIEARASQQFYLTTTEDGQVVYKLVAPKTYRFLGLFDRDIDTELTLDDTTGEATEEKIETTGLTGILDALSF